ncbi:MAG: hypothetical protein V3T17_15515 [Pseudomonadales bacterium]
MKIEYEIATQTYRFFLDHRMKMLNYALALNAALLVISVQYITDQIGTIYLSTFAVIATLLFLGFEVRTMQMANTVWDRLIELEGTLKYNTFIKMRDKIDSSGIPQRYYIRGVYVLFVIIWVGVVYYRWNTSIA